MNDVADTPSSSESRIRSTKRKLDDAFHILDDAVSGHNDTDSLTSDRPPPPKRSHTIKSLYSTLAKYGIKTKGTPPSESSVPVTTSKNTPNLSAILARAASKTKSTFSLKLPSQFHTPAPPLPPTAEYRPSSLSSFLSRLATYKLTTYANKPPVLDAVAASRCGWINDGKDRLVCGLCNASWVVAGREGLSREAANTLIEKQRASLVSAHKSGCPWKTRQCDDSIYCIPLQAPGSMIRDIRTRAMLLDESLKDVHVKHPLTTTQLNALRSTISSYSPPETPMDDSASQVSVSEPSETAILTSLFGWSLAPPTLKESSRRFSSSSRPLSRATSVAPSAPPSPPRTPPPTLSAIHRPFTAGPSSLARVPTSDFTFRMPSSLFSSSASATASGWERNGKPENALLQCELCQRRIGLWSFTTARAPVIPPVPPLPPQSSSESESRPARADDATNTPEPPMTPARPTTNGAGANGSSGVGETAGAGAPPATPTTPRISNPFSTPSSRPKKTLPQRSFDLLKEHRSYCPYVVKSTVVPTLPVYPSNSSNSGVGSNRNSIGTATPSRAQTPATPSRSYTNGSSHGHERSNSTASLSGHGTNSNGGGLTGVLEGWRAALTVVLRYGMAEKQRVEYALLSGAGAGGTSSGQAQGQQTEKDPNGMDVDMDVDVGGVDNVKAMVSGVKSRGGKDLLRYVKGLLG